MSIEIEAEVCHQCGGKGTVPIEQHTAACGIRCAPDCPRVVQRKCPTCAQRELGDDLNG